MRLSSFMIPANKVVWVTPKDTVRKVIDLMLEHNIGAIPVMTEDTVPVDTLSLTSNLPLPIGIITKSDILLVHRNMVGIDDPCEAILHRDDKPLQTCSPNIDHCGAAHILEQNHIHHIVVADNDAYQESPRFVGLVSSWDLSVVECTRDDRACLWFWSKDKRLQNSLQPRKKRSSLKYDKQSILYHDHDAYTVYMDDLDVLIFQ